MTVVERTRLDPQAGAYAGSVVASIDAIAPVVEGFVLGSAAAGGFDPVTSDLDLVVVLERPLGERREELISRLRELEPPFRDLELVAYVVGSQPPDFELNVNHGEERPDEEPFWFVLDAALAQEHAVPVWGRRPWSDVFEPVPPEDIRKAMQASLDWASRQGPDDEFARGQAERARHYLEHGEWITKKEAEQ
jgi:Nucleotidyltransferase domain